MPNEFILMANNYYGYYAASGRTNYDDFNTRQMQITNFGKVFLVDKSQVPVDGYSVMDHYFCDPKIENNIKVTIIRMHPTSRQLNKIETSI